MLEFTKTLQSIKKRDPAARSLLEIALIYPGMRAMLMHRVASFLWKYKFFFPARLISEINKIFSGIEIHPGAKIGKGIFIDHGSGVVIGETAEIHDNVTLYHGVTLGGLNPDNGLGGKRHPTVESGCVIGAGAQILGPINIGKNVRIGANTVVTKDVNEDARVIGMPSRIIEQNDSLKKEKFTPYGIGNKKLPKPPHEMIEELNIKVDNLSKEIEKLKILKGK